MPKFEIIKEKIAQLNVSDVERNVLFGIVNQLGFMLCVSDIATFTGLSKHIIKKTISELEKKKIIKICLYDDRKNMKNVQFTFGGVESAKHNI
jgi:DNA-binding MarR family transcriptional regulator